MQSWGGLIVRLDRTVGQDRRLDAEITGSVLGPPGWVIDPVEMPEGWDIDVHSDQNGGASYWMEAADVPHLTSSLEDAIAFAEQARPQDAAAIMALAMRQMPLPEHDETAALYAQRAARVLTKAVLRAKAAEELSVVLGSGALMVQATA